jgi:hypothetical protein
VFGDLEVKVALAVAVTALITADQILLLGFLLILGLHLQQVLLTLVAVAVADIGAVRITVQTL